MKKFIIPLIFLFTGFIGLAQADGRIIKELKTTRIDKAPKIDGKLDEDVWSKAEIATGFSMFQPGHGEAPPEDKKTEVRILYDDEALYIGATMHDGEPDRILKQLTDRDNFGTTDVFGLTINPNNDGQNAFMFLVTAAGVQIDAQISPSNGDDFSWNEVWYSKVSADDKGWYVEMKIPFSALRFSKEENYVWGINIYRNIEYRRELYSWNPIDKTTGQNTQYDGILTGMKNIQPPIRLGFYPFTSGIFTAYDGDTDTDFNFGMDVKYGITENFTLLATLVPDFSQAGFDNIVLNLSPFEQRYKEQRQFFIEGADLLNKGDLFFSRRIGSRPTDFGKVYDIVNENPQLEIVNNPGQVDVVNAIKVTGRSKKGLGLAVLNAITKETKATIKDTLSGDTFSVITEPLANYNVLVIDQEFNKNSSVGITNTNVIREGEFRDANVSALTFNLANKANSYKLSGVGSMSHVKEEGIATNGYSSELSFLKTKGHVRYRVSHRFMDDKYDKNDLGFQRRDNYNNITARISYQIFKPTKHFRDFSTGIFIGHFRRFKPNVYTGSYINFSANATTLKQLSFGLNLGSNMGTRKDFFEPRTEGRYWIKNPETEFSTYISTDYRKKLAFDVSLGTSWYNGNDEYNYYTNISPRFRANDKLQFSYSLFFDNTKNQLGYVTTQNNGEIIFGKRDVQEIENSISAQYNFNSRSSLALAFRHYWSPVAYHEQYYLLLENGELAPSDYTGDHDLNFNSWNFDLRYVWEFSRGSQLTALYRNSILNFGDNPDKSFTENISDLFDSPFGHMISVKFIYFLDYNKMRSWFKKK